MVDVYNDQTKKFSFVGVAITDGVHISFTFMSLSFPYAESDRCMLENKAPSSLIVAVVR